MAKDIFGYTLYKIKAGAHYCTPRWPRLWLHPRLRFSAMFGGGCDYKPPAGENAHDINKLFGYREGFSAANSVRVGWRHYNGRILLYPYIHAAGQNFGARDPLPICSVTIGETFTVNISATKLDYEIRVTCKAGEFYARGLRANRSIFRWLLYPYFGGTEPAPNDMIIYVKTLP